MKGVYSVNLIRAQVNNECMWREMIDESQVEFHKTYSCLPACLVQVYVYCPHTVYQSFVSIHRQTHVSVRASPLSAYVPPGIKAAVVRS